jgi:hypothetical protein
LGVTQLIGRDGSIGKTFSSQTAVLAIVRTSNVVAFQVFMDRLYRSQADGNFGRMLATLGSTVEIARCRRDT